MTIAPPVNLTQALASFTETYSPRIVARVNDYDVRVAHALGDHVWHVHADTFVVPHGTEHRPSSPGGSILMFEPSGTSSTGDHHEGEVPDHVDSTVGRDL